METKLEKDQNVITKSTDFTRIIRGYFSYCLLIVFFVIFSLANKNFCTFSNMATILEQSGVVLVVGMGMTLVIIAASIDLSVGSVLGLTAAIGAMSIKQFGPWGIIFALIVGILCGFINGLIFSKAKIPSFIATLGMMTICRGILLIITGATTVLIQDKNVRAFSSGTVLGIPNIFIVFIIVFVIFYIIFNYTPFGRYVKAVGGGEEVASLSGVNVEFIKMGMLVLSGFAAGVGGVLSAIRMGASSPTLGTSFEMDVIAAVVLGGTPLSGGIGKLEGTIIGALIMGMLNNGMNIMGISAYYQMLLKGIVLIIAVILTIDRKRIGIVK